MADDDTFELRDFSLDLRADRLHVTGPLGTCLVPIHGFFELINAFESPAALSRVLAVLPARGASDWAERASLVMELRRIGVLAAPGTRPPVRAGFAAPAIHAGMLQDAARVRGFLGAIREVVRPGDVVIDLGTGTGILAVAAARAGARHVYAIEESAISDVAREVFERNGVADRITLVQGHSTRVELPERGNVLVTETLGNDPLDEGILVYVEDARRRLLTEDARIVPERIDIVLQAVDVPLERTPLLTAADVRSWQERYGIDLGPLYARHPRATMRVREDIRTTKTFGECSEPLVVERIRLDRDFERSADRNVTLRLTRDLPRAAVSLGYDAQLSTNEKIEVGPHAQIPCPNWQSRVYARLDPIALAAGATLPVRYTRDLTACALELGP